MVKSKIFFHHTARKVRTVRPAGEKQPTHFTLLVEKISICTTGVSKESLRSHIGTLAFGSGDNYMRSETLFTFTYIHNLLFYGVRFGYPSEVFTFSERL